VRQFSLVGWGARRGAEANLALSGRQPQSHRRPVGATSVMVVAGLIRRFEISEAVANMSIYGDGPR
jgi:hypothetical protein